METYPRVLVGTDGSPDATAAVRVASRIAAKLDVPLTVVTVWERGDRDEDWANEVLADARKVTEEVGVAETTFQTAHGSAPEILADRANAHPEQLVVVGSAGLAKKTSRLLGSTSNRLTHHSLADVFFAKDPLPKAWHFVALATDGSPTSHHAINHGLALAEALGARPRMVTAAKSEEAGEEILDQVFADLGLAHLEHGIERAVFVDPQPAAAIINAGWKYELLVLGNRGMSGPARLLGSVANKVSHQLKTNLVLVNTTRDTEG